MIEKESLNFLTQFYSCLSIYGYLTLKKTLLPESGARRSSN